MAKLSARRQHSLLAFSFVLLVGASSATFMEPGMRDYCQWELFNASCPEGSVVVMNAARYGRMRLGRCIDTEFQIGCSADVLVFVDSRCSGRPRCVIQLPDNNLHHQQPCSKDMMAYMEASYTCVTVSDATHKTCSESGSIQLTAVEGYLSSYTAQELGHGAASCPWIITVKPGQKIKLTLMDFSIASRYKADGAQPPPPPPHQQQPGAAQPPTGDSNDDDGQRETMMSSDYCHLYATVSEHGGGGGSKKQQQQQQHICAKNTREYVAYASTSNSVAIELSEHVMTDSSVSFIIKFSVTGCADFEPPKSAWTERSGDRVTVRCNHTSQSWHMVCKGVVWIGQTSECQEDYPVGEKVVDDSQFPTYGLVIAVIIGVFVGSFCGFLLLVIVLWCKRHSLPRYDPEVELVAPPGESEHVCKVHRLPTGEYGYTHVWEVRNTQLPMPVGGGGGGGSSFHRPDDARSMTTQDSAYQTSTGGQSVVAAPAPAPADHVTCVGLTEALRGGGGRKEHVYECPIFDERFLLQRLQHYPHHHHYPPHGGICQQHGGRGFQGLAAPVAAAAAVDQTPRSGGMASPSDRGAPGAAAAAPAVVPASAGSELLLRPVAAAEEAEEDDKLRSSNFAAKIHGFTAVFTGGEQEQQPPQQQQQGNKANKATENHYL